MPYGPELIFAGISSAVTTMLTRFLVEDLSKNHGDLFSGAWVKTLVIFCAFYNGTANITLSIALTILLIAFLDYRLSRRLSQSYPATL